jgi:hypothetical protein
VVFGHCMVVATWKGGDSGEISWLTAIRGDGNGRRSGEWCTEVIGLRTMDVWVGGRAFEQVKLA